MNTDELQSYHAQQIKEYREEIYKQSEDKQKEYQNTLYVMDYKKVLVNEWGLGDHNNDIVIFDKQGKVLFSVDGQLNDSQIKQMLAAVKSGFN